MPQYRLARLSDEQFAKLEALEHELGLTLIAYEPAAGAGRDDQDAQVSSITDAVVNAYQSHP